MTRYRLLLVVILLPTLVMLWISWGGYYGGSLALLPVAASLAAAYACVAGLWQPKPHQPEILLPAVFVLIIYQLLLILFARYVPPPPSEAAPMLPDELRDYQIRLDLTIGSFAVYLTLLYPLLRSRRWLQPRDGQGKL